MTKEIINAIFPALVAVSAGLFGALFVGYVNHLLTKDRERVADRASRRREFVAFMRKWHSEISAIQDVSGNLAGKTIWHIFQEKIPDFVHQTSIVESVFNDKKKFDALTKQLAGLSQKDCQQKPRKEVILDAMERTIDFCS